MTPPHFRIKSLSKPCWYGPAVGPPHPQGQQLGLWFLTNKGKDLLLWSLMVLGSNVVLSDVIRIESRRMLHLMADPPQRQEQPWTAADPPQQIRSLTSVEVSLHQKMKPPLLPQMVIQHVAGGGP